MLVALIPALLLVMPVAAATASITHAYHSNSTIPDSRIVSLDPERNGYVEAANTTNDRRLVGISVDAQDALLVINEGQANSVQVATGGNARLAVSTINGSIKAGTPLSASPLSGIAMKAYSGERIIGTAQTALNELGDTRAQQIIDKTGHKTTVQTGYVTAHIAVGINNLSNSQDLTSLQRLGRSISGHAVSTTRILLSLIITVIAGVTIVTLIYASVHGTIIAVGRNPLARYAVMRSLLFMLAMLLLITSLAIILVYLLLH